MTYYCAACGKRLRPADVAAGRHVYSRHTGNRYCPARDDQACRRRAKKRGGRP